MLVPFLVKEKKMCFPDLKFTRAGDKNVLSLMVLIFLFMVIIET